ncbi:MAG: ABC transporter ATP-binding protein [Gammaproteobacteria bacterium]|nr:ABC transporter ATP-binding protein [Gammaproteobacteria bacterium]
MSEYILEVENLCVSAISKKGGLSPIVKNISFRIEPGKVIALIGESGSGKTTVSHACLGFARAGLKISGGMVRLAGEEVLKCTLNELQTLRGVNISYVAQSAAAAFNSALTIDTQVIEIPLIKNLFSRDIAKQKAVALYGQMDLPNPETIGSRYPHQVSGGQLQRLMAAMAMICDPKLLILDEPTTALDVTTQIEVLRAFKDLIKINNTSAIYVSHDLAVVAQIADNIMVMKDGEMIEYGPAEEIIAAPREDYTRELIEAAHVMPKSLPVARVSETRAEPVLRVNNVTAGYGPNQKFLALHGINISVDTGRTLGVIGESGSGKTTLGRVIAGLMLPSVGSIELCGRQLGAGIAQRSRDDLKQIQFAFQMADVALNPYHRIGKILGRPLQFYFGLSKADTRVQVSELLELVELPASFVSRFPRELSGGQRQRVNLARALAAKPKLIILDEITSALDTIVAKAILELLRDLQERLGVAYMFISHDISTIARVADDIAVMQNGRIVAHDTTANILAPPHHEYTELLLGSVPDMRTDWLDEYRPPQRSTTELPTSPETG